MNAEVEYNPKTGEWDPQIVSNGGGRGTISARRELAEAHKKHMASLSEEELKFYAESERNCQVMRAKNISY